MSRLMQLVYELCSKDITATKRDLFYSDVKLFKKQDESDAALEDVTCMLGCTRCSLHVVASEKGLVVGRLRYRWGCRVFPGGLVRQRGHLLHLLHPP